MNGHVVLGLLDLAAAGCVQALSPFMNHIEFLVHLIIRCFTGSHKVSEAWLSSTLPKNHGVAS